MIDIETSTPTAKAITDELLSSDFFNTDECSISTRQPRAIVSDESYEKLTVPWVEPAEDIYQELWQFSHITAGFAGRMLIGGGLLAYGVIHQEILIMIAGMLFLPLVPMLMGIGVGMWTRQWGLAGRASSALAAALVLLFISGIAIGLLSDPPLRYVSSGSTAVSVVISFFVGVAAALASTDDGGRRELIGLAAAAQIAIKPVWLGTALVLGMPVSERLSARSELFTLVLNIASIIIASVLTYLAAGALKNVRARKRHMSTAIQ
jgi:hypothetical protein